MKIGTHDGRFHCDEVLACTMLTNYVSKFKGAEIVRSRDPKVWDTCDIIVDVGGKYEPPRLLDHHQIEFKDTFPGYNIRLSSAGLVYLHYPEIIPNILDEIQKIEGDKLSFKITRNKKIEDEIRQKIYKSFIIYVDANDNGIDLVNQKAFSHVPSTIWSKVAKINPMWWEQNADEMQLFRKSMQVVKEELYGEVRQAFLGSIQTSSIVEEAFDKRKQYHASGKILVLQKYVPWQKPVTELEQKNKCPGEILFVVFPEKSGLKWRIQAVPLKEGSFELRKGLKEEWRGVKDIEKLVAISEIKDITFVHANGFIGGADSKENTILMGEKSL